MLHRIKMNMGRVILAAALAVAFVALLLVYMANDRAYVPPEDALGTRVSVEAFAKGYDAVVEELTTPVEPVYEAKEEMLLFSADEGGTAFLTETTALTITPKSIGSIYYTLDGSDPRISETCRRYHQPLTLEAGADAPRVYRIKASLLYRGNWSEVCSRTYFVGENIAKQFDIAVYSIEAAEEDLWSYERGVLNNHNQNRHGVEWERPMHVQLFDSDGTLMFDMPGGIRIYGGYSRGHIMKSMRITARKRYSTVLDDFNSLDLFGAMYDAEGVRIDRFEDIVIRNTGNDFGRAHLRDELIQLLMRKQGFDFTESVRPCLVYLNGELYGFFWMHEPYKESYFETRFGMYDYQGEFVVLDGPERGKLPDGEEHVGFDPLADYNRMLALGEKDLTDEYNYIALCQVLDVESYLQMHATMAYVDNGDWPQNNNRVFKYFAAEGEDFSDVYGMDGKWYFVPHDTDWCLSNSVSNNTLHRNYDPSVIQYSPLFCHLMERLDCRDIYVTYFLDMMNDQFKPANMRVSLLEMADTIRAGMSLYLQESPYIPSNFNMEQFDKHVAKIEKYVLGRADAVYGHLKEMYDMGKKYTLTIEVPEGVGVRINTIRNEGYFKGTYYSEYPTVISPIVPAGYEFDHWEINGIVSLSEEKTIPLGAAETGKVKVKLFVRATGRLSISEIGYSGGEDYIVLTNFGDKPVSTLGYALTDNAALPTRFRLPVMTVEPGESVVIYGKNYDPTVALRQLQLDFNFSVGETVTLLWTDPATMENQTIDEVHLPRLHEGYIYVRNAYENRFYEMTCSAWSKGE